MSTFESSHIHKKTQKAIFEKISALNRELLNGETTGNFFSANNTILESKQNPISQQIVRNCFARLSVDFLEENEDGVTGDLKAENISSFVNGGRLGKNTQANRPLAFNKNPNNDDENFMWRGETGITNIQVTQKSFFVNEITVSYTCPDPIDFEDRVKPKFLQLGTFAVIEFGWGIDSETFQSEVPEQTLNTLAKLQNNLQTFNEKYSGNYQVYCGDVTNYTFKVDENGYYSGTITIISRGNNVLHSTIDNENGEDKPVADFRVLRDREEIKKLYGDTKNLAEVFKNQDNIKKALEANEITFKGVIEGLEDVVDNYLSGTDKIDESDIGDALSGVGEIIKLIGDEFIWETIKTFTVPIKTWFTGEGRATDKFLELAVNQQQDVINGILEAAYRFDEFITYGIPTEGKVKNYTTAELQDVVKPLLQSLRARGGGGDSNVSYKFYNGAMEYLGYKVDKSTVNKQIIYPIGINDEKGKSRFLVSWGWFEDHILNSFFSLKNEYKNLNGGPDVEKELQSFRSVHKPLYYEVDARDRRDMKIKSGQEKDLSPTTPVNLTKFDKIKYSNRCNNSQDLKSLGLTSIILPGQTELPSLKRYLNQDDGIVLTQREAENKVEAERLYKVLQTIDEKFKKFGDPSDGYGLIRNMVFDVKYLKSHFLNITSVQDGIRSLFSDVNTKYGGFFNFMLKQDDESTGRIGVTDGHYMNPVEKSELLLAEDNTNDYPKYLEDKKELSSQKMFRFDLYTKNTIIKDFDLSLNLTDKAATMAYFNNVGSFVGGGYYNPNQIKDLSIERFTALTSAEVFNKQFNESDKGIILGDLKKKSDNYILNKVKIPVYSSGFTSERNDKIGLGTKFDDKNFIDKKSESNELIDNIGIDFRAPKIRKSVKEVKNRLKSKRNEERKNNINVTSEPPTKPGPAPYTENGEYDPFLQQVMKNNANNSRDTGAQSNYLLQKTIIPIDLNMTIDGVGGLRPGNLFRVDYLPKLYRKYCYFQVFTVSHQINTSGWSTSITAKMKLDFPKLYRDKILKIENAIDKDVMEMTVDELRSATLEEMVNPNMFERLDEELQEDIKELNQESYNWSDEETEIRYKIASDNTIKSSFKSSIDKGANIQSIAKSYVKRELRNYLPNQMAQNYNDFISKYSQIAIDKYNGKRITTI